MAIALKLCAIRINTLLNGAVVSWFALLARPQCVPIAFSLGGSIGLSLSVLVINDERKEEVIKVRYIPIFSHTPIEEMKAVPGLLEELKQMRRDSDGTIYNTDRNRTRVREIGERLNKVGGYALMLAVAQEVLYCDQRDLEMTWSGIGDWQA